MIGKRQIYWFIWCVGCALVVLSWYGIVSVGVGWTGFWAATAIAILSRIRFSGNVQTPEEYTEGDIRRFIAELTELIDEGKGYCGKLLIERGMWRQYLAEWEPSIVDLSRAIAVDSGNEAQARQLRGNAQYNLGQFEKAKEDLTFAIDAFCGKSTARENYADAVCVRAYCSLFLEQWADAIEDIDALVDVDLACATHHVAKAQALMHQNNFEDALASFQKARMLDSKCATAWQGVSYVRACCPDQHLRNGKKAVRCSKRACELTNWSDWTSISGLAAAYAEVGNFEKAVHYAERALDIAPPEESHERRERIDEFRRHRPYRHHKTSVRIRVPRLDKP